MATEKDDSGVKTAPYGYKADGTPKKTRGRPRKSEIVANEKGNRGKVGRPKGDAAIMNEYKARMLASPRSKMVLEKIMEAALNDEHRHQAAAWKLIMDRIAPVAGFEKEVIKGGGGNSIQISITGVPGVQINDKAHSGQEAPSSEGDEAIDGEWEKVDE